MPRNKKEVKTAIVSNYVRCKEFSKKRTIHLILIISDLVNDHSFTYLFVESASSKAIQELTKNSPNWGDYYTVIETSETFNSNEEVENRARELKKAMPSANVFIPAIVIK